MPQPVISRSVRARRDRIIGGAVLMIVGVGTGCADNDTATPDTTTADTVSATTSTTTSLPPVTAAPTTTEVVPTTSTTTTASTAAVPSTPTTVTTSPPATLAPVTPPEPGSLEGEIVGRYVGFWDARFAVNSGDAPGDPDDPRFVEYATGRQLEQVRQDTEWFRDQGHRLDHPDSPIGFRHVEVVSIEGDVALVQECVVDDGLVVVRASGSVVDDEVWTHLVSATMHRLDGVWKVEAARLIQEWEGIAGCALEH